jgi:hypothetical protein
VFSYWISAHFAESHLQEGALLNRIHRICIILEGSLGRVAGWGAMILIQGFIAHVAECGAMILLSHRFSEDKLKTDCMIS